ncbi:MAG: CoA-binding protein, partial [bacterium]
MSSLVEVMDSQNLAIIGASRDPFKPGALLIKVLQDTGFKGKVAGVNPGGGEVYGTILYPSLEAVPFSVDLAVFYIPPALVPDILEQCARKGVKGVVISAEGFAESGEDGRQFQEKVQAILRRTGIRGFGPNTLGLINTRTGLTTSYFSNQEMLQPGSIGFAAQSGVFVGALLRYFTSLGGLGISKGLGLGNKVDVDESDALQYFHADPETRFIGLYLEDVRDGRRFLETARAVTRDKPVLLLKGGRTARGAQATASHTASLAVDDAVFDGALRQAGVIRMDSIEEMVNTMMGFAWAPLPDGNRIALVTYSGAQAIMAIDAAIQSGLGLADFGPDTRMKIAEVIATDA